MERVVIYDVKGKSYTALLIDDTPVLKMPQTTRFFPTFSFQVNFLHDGNSYWMLNNRYHRLDGPAIEYANGSNFWHFKGQLHREDGPAIEYADGRREWWLLDHQLSEKAFWKIVS